MKLTTVSIALEQFDNGRHAIIERMVDQVQREVKKAGLHPGDWKIKHSGYDGDFVSFDVLVPGEKDE